MLSKVKSGSGRKIAHKCLVALADGYSNAINVPNIFLTSLCLKTGTQSLFTCNLGHNSGIPHEF